MSVDNFMTLKCVELAAMCSKHKPKPIYEISEMAKKHKIKILYLPVAHPKLNQIEMIWSQLKTYIKRKNVNYSQSDVEMFANEFFDIFDETEWVKCIDHVKEIEDQYLNAADDVPVKI